MRCQRGLVSEGLPALRTRRASPGVYSAVLDKRRLAHEGLAAHATLEGPLVTVNA